LIAVCIIVLPLPALHACASELRHISPTESNSACIGDPRTPTCAFETLLACLSIYDAQLCEAVGVDLDPEGYVNDIDYKYAVEEIREITLADITAHTDRPECFRLGNVALRARVLRCEIGKDDCSRVPERIWTEVLYPTAGKWHVVVDAEDCPPP